MCFISYFEKHEELEEDTVYECWQIYKNINFLMNQDPRGHLSDANKRFILSTRAPDFTSDSDRASKGGSKELLLTEWETERILQL